jgi:hypothetical protein
MSGKGVQECRAPGRRTSSLHMDVRSLAVPEPLYPAANATYEARSLITKGYSVAIPGTVYLIKGLLSKLSLQAKKRRLEGAFFLNTGVFSSLRNA